MILVIGSNGQLGTDLMEVFTSQNAVGLTHADIEITDQESIRRALDSYQPSVVINTAAYHRVDECERNIERAFQVNAAGVYDLALWCKEHDITLVHISTDYVFGGSKRKPYVESAPPDPINVYGVSKLAGEYFIKYILNRYFIIRTSGLYGIAGSSGKGGNFVQGMLKLAREDKDIMVVNDQILTPTYTLELARKIKDLIETNEYGLYHVTNNGECSWFEFAKEIFELSGLTPNLSATTTEVFGAYAKRPPYSVLENANLKRIGLDDMKGWRGALKDYFHQAEEGLSKMG